MEKEKTKISLEDLISEVTMKWNDTTEEKEENKSLMKFVKEFTEQEKYVELIKILQNKKEDENSIEEKYANFLRITESVKKHKKAKIFFENFFNIGVLCLMGLFAGIAISTTVFITLFVISLVIFGFYFVKLQKEIDLLNDVAQKEKDDFFIQADKSWLNIKKNNSKIYNPYVFVYYFLENTEVVDKKVLAIIFENFNFQKTEMSLEEMSNLFFSSNKDASSERGYGEFNGQNSMPEIFDRANTKRNNTNRLYMLKSQWNKSTDQKLKESLLNHFGNDDK